MDSDTAHPPPTRRLRIWPAVVTVLLALGIAQFVSFQGRLSRDQIVATTQARAYERTTRLHLEQLLSQYKDLETGSRGFLLSGRRAYLAPYDASLVAIPAMLAEIRDRKPMLPAGLDWRELMELSERRIGFARGVVELRVRLGAAALDDEHLLDNGKQAMDQLRERFARIDAAQDARIAEMNRQVEATRQRSVQVSLIGSGVAFALTLLAGGLVLRERQRRIALELALREANQSLEARVAERTAALEAARVRLAGFAAEQNRAIEVERRHLSREVHDQIGQVFTAIKLILNSVPRAAFPAGQAEALDQALEMGIVSTRRVTAVLRPPLLDDLGLGAALRHYAEDLGRSAGLAVRVEVAAEDCLDEAARLGLFRITQEAVTNVLRHADADSLSICGDRDGPDYLFRIADNGRGYDPATVRPGAIGLAGMRERAALLGAACEMTTAPGAGASVTLRLPLRHNEAAKKRDEGRDEIPAA